MRTSFDRTTAFEKTWSAYLQMILKEGKLWDELGHFLDWLHIFDDAGSPQLYLDQISA